MSASMVKKYWVKQYCLKHFQQKWMPILRGKMRKNKKLEKLATSIKGKTALTLFLFSLWGCAPSHEFQVAPQEGAQRSGTFPRFSDRPEAETSQLPPQTSQNLEHELTSEARKLRQRPNPPVGSAGNADSVRAEAEEILRQIEQGN